MSVPALNVPDSTVGFLREGYAFIGSRCDRLGTDSFRTRIAGRPMVCMRGASAAYETHRCPGERITVELIKKTAQLLASMRFTAPAQDLTYSLNRMLALPKSGFILQAPGYRKSSA